VTSRKQKRIVRMQRRPRVLLALPGCEERQVHAIVEAAHDWEWDLLDITMSRGYIPPEPTPLGAIVDCSPAAPLVKRLRRMGIPVVRLGGGGGIPGITSCPPYSQTTRPRGVSQQPISSSVDSNM